MNNIDRPIILDRDSDLLGTSIYVDILQDTITNSINDKNIDIIALFGPWGVGKTSIIKTVEARFKENKEINKINFSYFNAWKYPSKDFDKNFLVEINNEIEEKLFTECEIQRYELNNTTSGYLGIIFIIIVVLIIVSVNFFLNLNISSSILLAIGEYFLMSMVKNIFVETSYSKKKDFSFKDLGNIFYNEMRKRKYNTVFVIDDLDRCSFVDSINILEAINGMVKEGTAENYVFLIPIDKERIKKALITKRDYDEIETNNYLIKLFDLQISITELGNNNLYNMIEEICNKCKMRISKRSMSLLADYYVNTPRNVIKEINNINNEFSLLKQKIEYRNIKKSINHDEIVKFYILKNKWSKIYCELLSLDDKSNIDTTFENIASTTKDNVLRKFANSTKDISLSKINEYSLLKSDDYFYDKDIAIKLLNNNFSFEITNDIIIVSSYYYAYKEYILNNEQYDVYFEKLVYSYLYLLQNYKNTTALNRYMPINMLCSDIEKYRNYKTRYSLFTEKYVEIDSVYDHLINNVEKNKFKNLSKLTEAFIRCKELGITIIALKNRKKLELDDRICYFGIYSLVNNNESNFYDNGVCELIYDDNFYVTYINDKIVKACIINKKYSIINKIVDNKYNFTEELLKDIFDYFDIRQYRYESVRRIKKEAYNNLIEEFNLLYKMLIYGNSNQRKYIKAYLYDDILNNYRQNCITNNNDEYRDYIEAFNKLYIEYNKKR